jgi:hypothetical protein
MHFEESERRIMSRKLGQEVLWENPCVRFRFSNNTKYRTWASPLLHALHRRSVLPWTFGAQAWKENVLPISWVINGCRHGHVPRNEYENVTSTLSSRRRNICFVDVSDLDCHVEAGTGHKNDCVVWNRRWRLWEITASFWNAHLSFTFWNCRNCPHLAWLINFSTS